MVTVAVGTLSFCFLYFFRENLYSLAGVSAEIAADVDQYFSWRVLFHPWTLLFTALLAIYRGFGEVAASFYIILFTTTLNIILTGYWLFVAQAGIEGAAWGSIWAHVAGSLITLYLVVKKD